MSLFFPDVGGKRCVSLFNRDGCLFNFEIGYLVRGRSQAGFKFPDEPSDFGHIDTVHIFGEVTCRRGIEIIFLEDKVWQNCYVDIIWFKYRSVFYILIQNNCRS